MGKHSRRLPDGVVFMALVTFSAIAALVLQSGFFLRSDWMLGDLAYHRGVAYSMIGGNLQGSGPFHGLISYYGGLFPLLAAGIMRLTSWDFDTVISYVSWLSPLTLVVAFAALGRRLWPRDGMMAGLTAFLGSLAGPLSLASKDLWVDSVMVGSHNYWPAYPRDFALALVILASATGLSESALTRVFFTGVLIGSAILFHAQIGAVAALIVVALWIFGQAFTSSRSMLALVKDVGLFALTVSVVSVWWVLPRFAAAMRSGLALQSFPRGIFESVGPLGYIAGFGVLGVIAAVGLSRWPLRISAPHRSVRVWALAWLTVTIPLALLGSFVGDIGLITERRAWLMVSPVAVIMGVSTLHWFRSKATYGRFATLTALVAVLAVVPSAVGTIPLVRGLWQIDQYQGRPIERDEWQPIWGFLRHRVEEDGAADVLASDALSGAVWSWSGATVASMKPPGYVKFGFGVGGETGWPYQSRIAEVHSAFEEGLDSICRLAEVKATPLILLERRDDMLALYDSNPAIVYRVDPDRRSFDTINREVSPGVRYIDQNAYDALAIATGTEFPLPGWVLRAQEVEVEIRTNTKGHQRLLQLRQRATNDVGLQGAAEFQRVSLPVDPSGGEATIYAERSFILMRIVGFMKGPRARPLVTTQGLSLFDASSLCAGS